MGVRSIEANFIPVFGDTNSNEIAYVFPVSSYEACDSDAIGKIIDSHP